jgi:hypothetical protein
LGRVFNSNVFRVFLFGEFMSAIHLLSVRIGFALLISLTAGCASIVANSDRYAGANLTGYQTFAWMDGGPLIRPRGGEPSVSALNVRRIQEAIEMELAAKGYRTVTEPEQADFVVSFTVGSRDKIAVDAYPDRYRGPWEWGGYGRDIAVHTYTEGTLSIDIFDGAKHQPVWHGWATKQISGSDIADPAPVIKLAVGAIIREFPSRKP